MKSKKVIKVIIVYTFILLVISGLNSRFKIITIPNPEEMISRQIDYITISTVFAGFSFTALGLLLGLSSEELIRKIKNTDIIMNKVKRIINSIVFFLCSAIISLFWVLGLDISLVRDIEIWSVINSTLYVVGAGYLICGISYFIYSVYELYDLVRLIYGYNKKASSYKIEIAKEQLEKTRKKMRDAEEEEQ